MPEYKKPPITPIDAYIEKSSKHIGSAYMRDGKWVVELKAEKTRSFAQEPENSYNFVRKQKK